MMKSPDVSTQEQIRFTRSIKGAAPTLAHAFTYRVNTGSAMIDQFAKFLAGAEPNRGG